MLALTACGFVNGAHAEAPGEVAIRSTLAEGASPDIELWDAARWRDTLITLYEQREFKPLWFAGRQLNEAGRSLLHELRSADERGLESVDYAGNALSYLAIDLAGSSKAGAEEVALLDTAFSVSAARLVSDLHYGRVTPREAGHDLDLPHTSIDIGAALLALAASKDARLTLNSFEPSFGHYQLLKPALSKYRLLATDPELTQLPPLGRTASLKPGETYIGASALRTLLRAMGDMPPLTAAAPAATDDTILDPLLIEGLQRFQKRHGLDPDGALGQATWRELTKPFDLRVRQIQLSLERMRWLPPKIATPPIIVNIPQFRLFAFNTTSDSEDTLLQMGVIVGKSFKGSETPVFAADMRYLVLRPYWDVPYSILVREMLPSIRADPSWVQRRGFEIVRGQSDDSPVVPATAENIEQLARGALRIRQKPGPENALGLVKFMFPNRYNVYLHSTPAQGLFAEARRAYSHGCVRVEDPVALIQHVLRSDPSWTRERAVEAMKGDKPLRVPLPEPIRVFMVYATALAAEDGTVLFFDDIYGHDVRLDALLRARLANMRHTM